MHGLSQQRFASPDVAEQSREERTASHTKGRNASISCEVPSERPMVWWMMWLVPMSLLFTPPVICARAPARAGSDRKKRV